MLHLIGQPLGVSPWHDITQDQVNLFADSTGDHQWIHVDPVRAAAGPFGGPIAHGYLTLALGPLLIAETLHVEQLTAALNYGLNKVRFPTPVPVGSRLRGVVTLVRCTTAAGRDRSGLHRRLRTRGIRPTGLRRRVRGDLPLITAIPPAARNTLDTHARIRQSEYPKESTMPEAVIVAATRSPIGRAFKGSLEDLRPDDLAATVIRAALDQVPELDVNDIDDLMLGCGLPGGEQGNNLGRVVSVLLGLDRAARNHHHPVLRVLPADLQDGAARDQGRRGRRLHLGRSGNGVPVRQGQL